MTTTPHPTTGSTTTGSTTTGSTTPTGAPGTVLIAGGAGHTGRRVADHLAAAITAPAVRFGSRSSAVPLDWEDPTTFGPALAGVEAVYLAYSPDLAFPGAAEKLGIFASAAAGAGVGRLVLLSGRGEPGALRSVESVRAAGVPTAALYSAWFAQNFSESFLADQVADGTVALPAEDVAEPFVDLEDLAAVATRLLLADSPQDVDLDLTGPSAITFGEACAHIGTALGREIAYLAVDVDDFAAGAAAGGMPVEEARELGQLFTEILDGRNSGTTDDVARWLGRPATSFAQFVDRTVREGGWAPPAVADDR